MQVHHGTTVPMELPVRPIIIKKSLRYSSRNSPARIRLHLFPRTIRGHYTEILLDSDTLTGPLDYQSRVLIIKTE
jgi:hypothetical protein